MLTDPPRIPAAPNPATALPIISATELGAAPQIAEPISNIEMLKITTVLTSKKV